MEEKAWRRIARHVGEREGLQRKGKKRETKGKERKEKVDGGLDNILGGGVTSSSTAINRIAWERPLLIRFLLLKHFYNSYFQAWIAIEEQLKSLKRRKTASGGVTSSDSEEDL